MTIPYTVQVGKSLDIQESTEVEKIILSTFAEINSVYNNWNPQSEISKLNRLPASHPCMLSSELNDFLKKVDQFVKASEGRFDPTVLPLALLWKTALTEGHLPREADISRTAESIGWDKIHVENGIFWKEHPLTAMDLGGVAKGYGVDLLVERLTDAGFSSIYVEWGGEIRVHGLHPQKRPWKIGIKGGETVELIDCAVATSGSYIQNWEVKGVQYTHIINPQSKCPLADSRLRSVTLIAPTCAEADAMATALMVIQSKETAECLAEKRGLKTYVW